MLKPNVGNARVRPARHVRRRRSPRRAITRRRAELTRGDLCESNGKPRRLTPHSRTVGAGRALVDTLAARLSAGAATATSTPSATRPARSTNRSATRSSAPSTIPRRGISGSTCASACPTRPRGSHRGLDVYGHAAGVWVSEGVGWSSRVGHASAAHAAIVDRMPPCDAQRGSSSGALTVISLVIVISLTFLCVQSYWVFHWVRQSRRGWWHTSRHIEHKQRQAHTLQLE